MPVKTDISETTAFAAIRRVLARGDVPTQAAVQREVGRGSYPVIAGYIAQWFDQNGPSFAADKPAHGTAPLSLQRQLEEMTRLAAQEISEAERKRAEALDDREAALDSRASGLAAREEGVMLAERRQLEREMAQVELIDTLKTDRDIAIAKQTEVATQLAEAQTALAVTQSVSAELRGAIEKAETALTESRNVIAELQENIGRNNEARSQLEAQCARAREDASEAVRSAESARAGEAGAQATALRMAAEIQGMQEAAQATGELLNNAIGRASAAEAIATQLRAALSSEEERQRDAAARAKALAESVASLRDSLARTQHREAQVSAENETMKLVAAALRSERDEVQSALVAAIPLMERLEARLANDKK